jgi:O-antigen ligase/polysaccharide polymerase Wzy-like membrane protein
MNETVAAAGVFLLATFAPFEPTTPLLQVPGQSLTILELVLLVALMAWAAAVIASRRIPWVPSLAWPWVALVAAMAVSSLLAPEFRLNAFHMTGRFASATAVLVLASNGITTVRRVRMLLAVCVITGTTVAAAVLLEALQVPSVLSALDAFRPSVTVLGGQVRGSGTLQYPTIASMYLEVVFAAGLALMLIAHDETRRLRAGLLFVVLVVIADAIVLTLTRAGLVSIAVSLVLAGWLRFRHRPMDTGLGWIGALAVSIAILIAASHTSQLLWLRLTSEGQSAWYRAEISAPETLSLKTAAPDEIVVSVTNSGRATWDSGRDPPIFLSYHWLDGDGRFVVAFEGERTSFARPVGPGATTSVRARVRAPGQPGQYRLEWDLVQQGRLWFSTEADAPDSAKTFVRVVGPPIGGALRQFARPERAVRPGRFELWTAAVRMIAEHPLFGVGPDNFRLLYGSYTGQPRADARIHSNNMYLEIVAGGGIVAAVVLLWLLRESWRTFRSIGASPNPAAIALVAAGAAIALHGLVDSFVSFAPTYILFALILGCAAAAPANLESGDDAHRV